MFSSTTTTPATPALSKLFFGDERAIGFQKHHENIEGAPADLDRNPVGKQLPPA